MAVERDIANAVEAAFLEQLSPYDRARVVAGEACIEEVIVESERRITAQQAALEAAKPSNGLPAGTLVVRWCSLHGWERVGTIDAHGQLVLDPTE